MTCSSLRGPAVGPGQRHPPVGVLVLGAGLVDDADVADEVGHRDAEHARGSLGQEPVQGLHRLGDLGVLGEQAALDQGGPDLADRVLLDGLLLLDGTREEPEAVPQRDVLEPEVPGGRRQVMGRHGRQAQVAVLLRRQRPAVLVPLEPQDRRPEDAALAHVVADPGLDHPEVLAHDDGPRTLGLQHEDADERLVVVAHVGAFAGRVPFGDPPEAEQADDVVDADATGVLQDGAEHVAVGRVAELGETVGSPRRLVPVLAQLVELVGGAPTDTPRASASGRPQASAPRGLTPTARS